MEPIPPPGLPPAALGPLKGSWFLALRTWAWCSVAAALLFLHSGFLCGFFLLTSYRACRLLCRWMWGGNNKPAGTREFSPADPNDLLRLSVESFYQAAGRAAVLFEFLLCRCWDAKLVYAVNHINSSVIYRNWTKTFPETERVNIIRPAGGASVGWQQGRTVYNRQT